MPNPLPIGNPDEDDVFIMLYASDAGPETMFLQVNDFLNNEHAEMGLNKEQALELGLALVNWAGGN